MNGEDLLVSEPSATGGNVFSDFFGAAQTKIGEITSRYTTLPTNTQSSVGGSIFEALYQYGKGRADLARERAATALLASRTGQRFIGEVEQQRLQQWMPMIVIGVIAIFLGAFLLGRR